MDTTIVAVMMRTERDKTGIKYEIWIRTDEATHKDNLVLVWSRRVEFEHSREVNFRLAARDQDFYANAMASTIGKPISQERLAGLRIGASTAP